jgi:hypothetical protein
MRHCDRLALIPNHIAVDICQARKRFFLKKEAKTFIHEMVRCRNANVNIAKVFWFFFSKKNCYSYLPNRNERHPSINSSHKKMSLRNGIKCRNRIFPQRQQMAWKLLMLRPIEMNNQNIVEFRRPS